MLWSGPKMGELVAEPLDGFDGGQQQRGSLRSVPRDPVSLLELPT
jgi:hypothetical protein